MSYCFLSLLRCCFMIIQIYWIIYLSIWCNITRIIVIFNTIINFIIFSCSILVVLIILVNIYSWRIKHVVYVGLIYKWFWIKLVLFSISDYLLIWICPIRIIQRHYNNLFLLILQIIINLNFCKIVNNQKLFKKNHYSVYLYFLSLG